MICTDYRSSVRLFALQYSSMAMLLHSDAGDDEGRVVRGTASIRIVQEEIHE